MFESSTLTMKLINKIQSPQSRLLRFKPRRSRTLHQFILTRPPPFHCCSRHWRQRPLQALVLDEAIFHPLLHPVNRNRGILLFLVLELHLPVGIATEEGGLGQGLGGLSEEGGEVIVGGVEGGVDLDDLGWVGGGRRNLFCHQGRFL